MRSSSARSPLEFMIGVKKILRIDNIKIENIVYCIKIAKTIIKFPDLRLCVAQMHRLKFIVKLNYINGLYAVSASRGRPSGWPKPPNEEL
jgi:hypothetical protein